MIVEVPLALATGVTVTVQFGAVPPKTIPPLATTEVFDEDFNIEVLQLSELSTSAIVKARALVAVSSLVVWSAIAEMVGASFVAVTVRVKAFESVVVAGFGCPLSVILNVIFEVPVWLEAGVNVKVQLGYDPPMMASLPTTPGMSDVFEEESTAILAEEQFILGLESTSYNVKGTTTAVSSAVESLEINDTVGASFTALTVKANVRLALREPSVTVNVTLATPDALETGVNVAVQFGAVPPILIPATCKTAVFDEVPLTDVAQVKELSVSLIVKEIALVATSSLVVWSEIAEIVGG